MKAQLVFADKDDKPISSCIVQAARWVDLATLTVKVPEGTTKVYLAGVWDEVESRTPTPWSGEGAHATHRIILPIESIPDPLPAGDYEIIGQMSVRVKDDGSYDFTIYVERIAPKPAPTDTQPRVYKGVPGKPHWRRNLPWSFRT